MSRLPGELEILNNEAVNVSELFNLKFINIRQTAAELIDRVKALRLTRHKIGNYGDASPSGPLGSWHIVTNCFFCVYRVRQKKVAPKVFCRFLGNCL